MNSTKAILIDLDGIVVSGKKKKFSERMATEYGVDIEKIIDFIRNEYSLCKIGKADLRKVLEQHLEEWNWPGTAEDLMKYWFHGETEINKLVVSTITQLRKRGIKCYIASDNEKYRADYLMNALGLNPLFDGTFFSFELGYRKPDPEFFAIVLDKLAPIKPDEVMLWDDKETNLVQARKLGIQTRLYTTDTDFVEYSLQLINPHSL